MSIEADSRSQGPFSRQVHEGAEPPRIVRTPREDRGAYPASIPRVPAQQAPSNPGQPEPNPSSSDSGKK